MKITTFDQYLRDIHAKQYTGTDDDMPDDFEFWVSQLKADEIMKFAEECINEIIDTLV